MMGNAVTSFEEARPYPSEHNLCVPFFRHRSVQDQLDCRLEVSSVRSAWSFLIYRRDACRKAGENGRKA